MTSQRTSVTLSAEAGPTPNSDPAEERNTPAPVGNGTRELQLEAEIERLRGVLHSFLSEPSVKLT